MKYLIVTILILASNLCKSQEYYYGPTQVGNNNTQNNYMQRHFTDADGKQVLFLIKQIESDSNFHHIKYFEIEVCMNTNGLTTAKEISKYMIQKGFKQIGNGPSTAWYPNPWDGVKMQLVRADSAIWFRVGQVH